VSFALLCSIALLGAGTVPAAADSVADSSATLPISSASDIVVDGVHQRVFISSPADNSVLVTDFNGSVVGEIDSEPGAQGLALNDDSSFLYVALPDAHAISMVNTSTLQELNRIPTGINVQPRHLAVSGDKVWFGYDSSQEGKLGFFDRSAWNVALDQDGSHHFESAPVLTTSNTAPGVLAAGSTWLGTTEIRVYDISSNPPVPTAYTAFPSDAGSSGLQDMAITQDGTHVVTAGGSASDEQAFRMSDLSVDGSYTTGPGANAVAVAGDSRIAAGVLGQDSHDLSIFQPNDSTALQSYDLTDELLPAGLAWTPLADRLLALTQPQGGGPVTLRVIGSPARVSTTLSLQAPATAHRGKPLTLTGVITSGIPLSDGYTVMVTRTDSVSPGGVTVGTPSVASDGSFTLTDTPPVAGTVVYTVTYPGDYTRIGAEATATVRTR
jgi:hypothetical protein